MLSWTRPTELLCNLHLLYNLQVCVPQKNLFPHEFWGSIIWGLDYLMLFELKYWGEVALYLNFIIQS